MKIRKTFSINEDVFEQFQKYAKENGRSVSSLIEEFMRKTLKEQGE